MAQRLKLAGQFHTRAAFEPSTFDPEKGTVEVCWTTGARGMRRSWDGPYFEELEVSEQAVDLSRMNNGASVLNAHSQWDIRDVIGVVERAWIKGKEGRALVRFSDREDVKPIRKDVQDGVLRHISVGYSVQKYEQVEKVDEVPVYRATKWTPAELSLVPIAFDDGAVVRGREAQPYEVEVLSRSEEPHMPEKIQTEKPAAPVAEVQLTLTDEQVRAAETRGAEAGAAAERERVTVIRSLVTAHKLEEAFGEKLVKDGVKIEAARAAILDKLATATDAVRTESHIAPIPGGDAGEKFQRGAGAWLLEKAGVSDLIARAGKVERRLEKVELDGGEFRGMSLLNLARECLERSGVNTRRMNDRTLLDTAWTHRSAGQSTSDFSTLLEAGLGKVLLAAYATADDTWSRFCRTDTVSDFRVSQRYRSGSIAALETVAEGGEFKQGVIPDGSKLPISTATKGRIFSLSRQALVNDDMGALANTAQIIGRAARLSIELDVYALLALNSGLGPTQADSSPFFDDTLRANVSTTAAISVAALDLDRVKMAMQKDTSNNEYLSLRPAVLLVHSGNYATARVINTSANDPTTNKLAIPNPVQNLFRDIVESPRVPAGTGATTRRYIFADPTSPAASIAVAFLEGQGQGPVLDTREGWRVDGTEWKVRIDYKAQMFDPKGALTNAG